MDEPLRVLVLEDNPHDAEIIQFELQEAGVVTAAKVVTNEKDYIQELRTFSPGIILSDYDLPRYNGVLALAEAKKQCPDVPFILVTGAVTEDRAIEILTSGAKDFVMKNRLAKLAPAVRRAVAEAEEHKARREAEKKILEASLYARSLLEASVDPLVTISSDGKVMDVNMATEEVTGVHRDRIIGTDFSDYFTEPEKARAGYMKVFSEGSVKDYPLAIRHTSGRITEVLYNASIYKNEDGAVQGVFAAARDVTELKRTEAELRKAYSHLEDTVQKRTVALEAEIAQRKKTEMTLRKSSDRLAMALHASNAGTWDWDITTGRIEWSAELFRIFGLDPNVSNASLDSWEAIIYPDDRELAAARIEEALQNRTVLNSEYRVVHPEGRVTWINALGEGQYDKQGRPVRMTGICLDITERRRIEEGLRRSEATLRGILDSSQESVWLFSPESFMLMGNPTAYQRFGKPPEEIIGKHFNDILPPELAKSRLMHLKQTVESKKPVEFVDERAGIIFRHTFCPVLDDDGNVNSVASFSRDITEREKADKEADAYQARLRMALEAAGAVFWEWDIPSRSIHYSDDIRRIVHGDNVKPYGSLDELMSLIHPEDRETLTKALDEASKEGTPFECEYRVLMLDGAYHWILGRGKRIVTEGGKPVRVIGLSLDITDRKEAQEALRESEERERERSAEADALILYAPTGIYEIDLRDHRFLSVNDTMCRILGYTREELFSIGPSALLDEGSRAVFADRIRRQLDGEKIEEVVEYRVRKKDGTFMDVILNASFNPGGNSPHKVLVVAHDITERKQAERLVAKSMKDIETILDSITDIYISFDRAWRFADLNGKAEDVIGKRREDILGKVVWDVFPAMRESEYARQYRIAVEKHIPVHFEALSILGRWYETHAYPTDNGLSVYFKDITDRKKAEEELEEKARELGAAYGELEGFSYSVSHDLRAPLRAINGYLRMILKRQGDDFDDETKRLFDKVRDGAKVMDHLIDDLLALSKLSKEELREETIDMRNMIEMIWTELQRVNPGRKITLKMNPLPPACGDKNLLMQVFVNILSNAVKFTKTRDVAVIEVGGYKKENEVVYYVKDNGVGFDIKYSDKLFRPFQRFHDPAEYEGTGIGTAIVQRIIHRHGGRVWAEGKVNEGATFYFTLPRPQG
ncbi:MAG: PAS domain S-box protein [Syntrophales bacterium]|jgi:PAS domain S-box-containing protein|nr:PAS domain S-box protein [Syntrophales bacterium]